ncbi:fructosamine kinase [Halobacillus fulvus]|nr:fructosamine kinase [Halobacillus fulvus]
MKDIAIEGIKKSGDTSPIDEIRGVGGGDINHAFYAKTKEKAYFVKVNKRVPPHFFESEAENLKLIRETGAIAVPDVHYYDRPQNLEPAAMVMEWIEHGSGNASAELGERIAQMHRHTSEHYGLMRPTFVGALDQPNEWRDSWVEYYGQFRLKPQLEYAIQKNRVTSNRRSRLELFIEKLDEWIPSSPPASLLHGDLWGGNWMTGQDNQPYIIDPSCLYGDPAFEIAFTELFGGFSPAFYEAYAKTTPLPEDYEDRKPVYQLFYLLVHLNMFGESYGGSVDQILKRYVQE